ncbi:MAG: procyclic acidic repetitive family protein [Dehalococcoidia bacterium]|nr:procyclic acidic repetitive family protein [Dehalococcoidia bacterium]
MKGIATVSGLVLLVTAAFFATNVDTASAGPPLPFDIEDILEIPLDDPPPVEPDIGALLSVCDANPFICGEMIDLCALNPDLCEDGAEPVPGIEPAGFCELHPDLCGGILDICVINPALCDVDEPDDADEPEPVDEPELVDDPEPADEPAPADEPEPADEPGPADDPEPADGPDPADDSGPADEPDGETAGGLPSAGNGGSQNRIAGVDNSILLLVGMSLGGMALAWLFVLVSMRRVRADR